MYLLFKENIESVVIDFIYIENIFGKLLKLLDDIHTF